MSSNYLVLLAAVPSFLITLAAVPWVQRRASEWGLVARPRNDRFHKEPTPLGGGLAIWLGVVGTFAAVQILLWLIALGVLPIEALPQLLATHFAGLEQQAPKLWVLLAAATVMMILGLIDDRGGVNWRSRLGVQAFVAAIMVWQGWQLTAFIDAPLVTAALSVIWIVGIVNAFNMLDNMDGLSAGVAWIAAAFLIAVILTAPSPASNGPQLFVAGFLLVLTGALAGFWRYNRPPATIFMGDAGSYFVGFCLATATLMATFAGGDMPKHAVFAPLCVLAVPIYDMLTVVVIRLRAGRSPFEGDKNHFSHRLVALGLSPTQAVWTIYLLTAACGLGALLLHQVNELGAVVILVMIGCMLSTIAILEATARRDR
ncbi:MAG TPA: MraY family glycosyltransferase [Lacipirellulaceae bacterium]